VHFSPPAKVGLCVKELLLKSFVWPLPVLSIQISTLIMGDVSQAPLEYDVPVVIVGGGPVGMLTAFELSRLGIECLLAEQSLETTKWPKMDLTNCRSMEIMRMIGISDEYRAQKGAVNVNSPSDSLFYNSCGPAGKVIAAWVCKST
jgi:hypothetical protein